MRAGTVPDPAPGCEVLPNIRRLLVSVAPAVPTREACGDACCSSFALDDLWNAMDMASAFGVEVSLSLGPDGEVTQTYVPYLSAIQLFARDRRKGGGPDPASPGESDDDATPAAAPSAAARAPSADARRPAATPASAATTPASPSSACSDSEASDSAASSADGWAASVLAAAPPPAGEPPRGPPLFEWCETAPPHERAPLSDAARALAASAKPGASLLRTSRSSDLHPASWFAVAWYPLYALPSATGRAARDLGGAFLTLHSLAPPRCCGGGGGGVGAPPPQPSPPCRCTCPDRPAFPPNQPSPPCLGPVAAAVAEGRRAAAAARGPPGAGAALLPAWGLATYKVPVGPAPPSAPPGTPLPLGGPWADPGGAAAVAAMRAAAAAWVDRRRAPAADLAFFASRAPRA